MRQFHTFVLERLADFEAGFETEPIETGWASEAIFFVRAHDVSDGTTVDGAVQISPDGITWLDEGTVIPTLSEPGDSFVRVTHFGGWLRLRINVTGDEPGVRLTIHLVLKE